MVRYTVGDVVLNMISECISNDIPHQMKILCGYPHSNAFRQSYFKLELCKQHKAHPMKCDVINDIKLFPTVYPRNLTLSN